MNEKRAGDWRVLLATLWGVGCAVAMLSTLGFVAAAYTPGQWADQWAEVLWLQRYDAGEARLADLWRLHNDTHAILVPRLFYLIDYLAFQGTNAFLIVMNLAIQACMGVLLLQHLRRAALVPALRQFLIGLTALLLFSAVQLENFVWGFQVPFVLVFACAIAAIMCAVSAVHATSDGPRRGWVAATLAFALASTFSMANGVLVWPVLVLLTLVPPRTPGVTAAVGAGAVVGIGLWLRITPHTSTLSVVMANPVERLLGMALYLGSPIHMQSIPAAGRLGVAGLVGAVVLSAYHVWRWRSLDRFARVHLAIVWFAAGAALATSVGRAEFGLVFMLQMRYATGALVFWVALLHLALVTTPALGRAGPAARVTLVAATVLLTAGWLIPSHLRAGRSAIAQARAREAYALSLVAGVYDADALVGLWLRPAARVPAFAAYTRARRLGTFAQAWAHDVGEPLADRVDVVTGDAAGSLASLEQLPYPDVRSPDPALGPGLRVAGTSAATKPQLHRVLIVDDAGTVRGIARPTKKRVPAGDRQAWRGYVQATGPPVLTAYAVDTTDRARRLPGHHLARPLMAFASLAPAGAWEQDAGWLPNRFSGTPEAFTAGYAFASTAGTGAAAPVQLRSPLLTCTNCRYLAIPYLTGPDAAGLSLVVEDAAAHTPRATLELEHAVTDWTPWVVPWDGRAVHVVARDGNPATAAWLAVGEPRSIP